MKDDQQELRKESQEVPSPVTDSRKFDDAVKAVYKKYGTDLAAFWRDAYKAAARERKSEPADNEIKACA